MFRKIFYEIRAFHRYAEYYKRFIPRFSSFARSLNAKKARKNRLLRQLKLSRR